jgi:hypothetical protein
VTESVKDDDDTDGGSDMIATASMLPLLLLLLLLIQHLPAFCDESMDSTMCKADRDGDTDDVVTGDSHLFGIFV